MLVRTPHRAQPPERGGSCYPNALPCREGPQHTSLGDRTAGGGCGAGGAGPPSARVVVLADQLVRELRGDEARAELPLAPLALAALMPQLDHRRGGGGAGAVQRLLRPRVQPGAAREAGHVDLPGAELAGEAVAAGLHPAAAVGGASSRTITTMTKVVKTMVTVKVMMTKVVVMTTMMEIKINTMMNMTKVMRMTITLITMNMTTTKVMTTTITLITMIMTMELMVAAEEDRATAPRGARPARDAAARRRAVRSGATAGENTASI
eukprot:gene216-biopygen12424